MTVLQSFYRFFFSVIIQGVDLSPACGEVTLHMELGLDVLSLPSMGPYRSGVDNVAVENCYNV